MVVTIKNITSCHTTIMRCEAAFCSCLIMFMLTHPTCSHLTSRLWRGCPLSYYLEALLALAGCVLVGLVNANCTYSKQSYVTRQHCQEMRKI